MVNSSLNPTYDVHQIISLSMCTHLIGPPAPKYVTAEVINGTAIIVYWQKIDITEARGHISGYVVSYSLDSEKIESQELTEKKTVGPDENQAVLSDLRKGGTYRVSVSAFNPNGDVGDASYSEPIILLATTESKGLFCNSHNYGFFVYNYTYE